MNHLMLLLCSGHWNIGDLQSPSMSATFFLSYIFSNGKDSKYLLTLSQLHHVRPNALISMCVHKRLCIYTYSSDISLLWYNPILNSLSHLVLTKHRWVPTSLQPFAIMALATLSCNWLVSLSMHSVLLKKKKTLWSLLSLKEIFDEE